MGKQTLTRADAKVGKLSAKGGISSSSGAVSAALGVSAGSQGFTITPASVTFLALRQRLSTGTTGIRSYGAIVPAGFVVESAYLDIQTGEATASTKTAHVGLSGQTSGFLLGISTASAANVGIVLPSIVPGSVTAGSLFQEGSAASGRFFKAYAVNAASAATLVSHVAEAQTELVADVVLVGYVVG